MTIHHAVSAVVSVNALIYWACVCAMAVRVRRKAHKSGRAAHVLVPAQRSEQIMWLIWIPLVVAWIALPGVAAGRPIGESWSLALPSFVENYGALALRVVAALVAVGCLLGSIRCWGHMGEHWRMAVDPNQRGPLLTDGPFGAVRHPIYALSILMMTCSLIAVPTPLMALVAAIHVALMNLKARNEERFLRERHGQAFVDYCGRTRRFIPRFGRRSPPPGQDTGGSERGPSTSAAPSVGAVPLDPFQRLMTLWETLHPYNAVHWVRLRGRCDPERLRVAVNEACRAAGIGELRLDPRGTAIEYSPVQSIPVRESAAGANLDDAIVQLCRAELNTPYPRAPHHPIRWTILSNGEEYALVAGYRHLASDAHGMARLLADVLRRCNCATEAGGARLTTRWPENAPRPMRFERGGGILNVTRTVALYFRLRMSHKMPDERDVGDATLVVVRSAPAGLLGRLRRACEARGAGLNDVFLAALSAAIAGFTPDRRVSRHRRGIALASALSTRSLFGPAAEGVFGTMVGDMLIRLPKPDVSVGALLEQVARQTGVHKRDKKNAVSAAAARHFCIRSIWPFFGIPHERRSYRKLFPVCGGVSTFVAPAERLSEATVGRLVSYARACPPGPAMPLVLAPTVCGDDLELSLVFREACMNAQRGREMLDAVVTHLEALAAES